MRDRVVACAECRHFANDVHAIEAIPGLRTLSSGYAAVRDRDGLCSRHDRYLPASSSCAQFARRVHP